MESSLNLRDETAREIVKETFKVAGQDCPQASIHETMNNRQNLQAYYSDSSSAYSYHSNSASKKKKRKSRNIVGGVPILSTKESI